MTLFPIVIEFKSFVQYEPVLFKESVRHNGYAINDFDKIHIQVSLKQIFFDSKYPIPSPFEPLAEHLHTSPRDPL